MSRKYASRATDGSVTRTTELLLSDGGAYLASPDHCTGYLEHPFAK